MVINEIGTIPALMDFIGSWIVSIEDESNLSKGIKLLESGRARNGTLLFLTPGYTDSPVLNQGQSKQKIMYGLLGERQTADGTRE